MTHTFGVDTQTPNTTITSGPSGNARDRTPSVALASSEPQGASFERRLDSASVVACASPEKYSSFSFGSHTFRVRAIDRVGNSHVILVIADPKQRYGTRLIVWVPELSPSISRIPTTANAAVEPMLTQESNASQ